MAKSLCLQIKKYGIFLIYWPLNALRKRFKIKNVPLIPRNLWSIRWMFLFSHKQKSQQFICHWVNVPLLTSTDIWKSHLRNVSLFTTTEIFKSNWRTFLFLLDLKSWQVFWGTFLFSLQMKCSQSIWGTLIFSLLLKPLHGIRGTFHLSIHLKAKTSYIKFK